MQCRATALPAAGPTLADIIALLWKGGPAIRNAACCSAATHVADAHFSAISHNANHPNTSSGGSTIPPATGMPLATRHCAFPCPPHVAVHLNRATRPQAAAHLHSLATHLLLPAHAASPPYTVIVEHPTVSSTYTVSPTHCCPP